MAIYKFKQFSRWAKKEDIDDGSLCKAVKEIKDGILDANLGGGLLKKRVARRGQGKRGGYRTLIASNMGTRWIFIFGFSKTDQENISARELRTLKEISKMYLCFSDEQVEAALRDGALTEVIEDESD